MMENIKGPGVPRIEVSENVVFANYVPVFKTETMMNDKPPRKKLKIPTDAPMGIPISAAKHIANKYGYDQVIIIARKTGTYGSEHVTTYGKDKTHCDIAAKTGDFLKFKVMGWKKASDVG